MVDDGQRGQVGLLDEARGLLLVGVGDDHVVVLGHEVGDDRVGVGGDQVGQGDGADELAVPVGDRQDVQMPGARAQVADAFDRRGGVHGGPQRHVVGGHDAPGRLGVVAEQLRGRAALGRTQLLLEAGGDDGGHLVEELRPVVGLHGVEQVADGLGLERVEQFLLVDGVELFEDGQRAVLGEQAETHGLVGQFHARELFGEFDDRGLGEVGAECGEGVHGRGGNGLDGLVRHRDHLLARETAALSALDHRIRRHASL